MNNNIPKIFALFVILLFVTYPIATAQLAGGTNQEQERTDAQSASYGYFVYDNAHIIKDWQRINTALNEINRRLNVKFIIETGSLDDEMQPAASSIIGMYLEQSTFARRKFSRYGLDDRYDPSGLPALNLLIYFDPKLRGVIIDSENCGYNDEEISTATNNKAVANFLRERNYDDAFLLMSNELAKLAEQRLQEGVDCRADFEEENPKADELVLISTFAQFDPNWEAARLRMAEAARRLAQDLQAKGKISNAGNAVHEFNLQAKKALYGRELKRETRNLEAKLEAIRSKDYKVTETPILEYYEDEAEEKLLKEELEGVKFVLACVEKGIPIKDVQANPESCIDESIIDKIGSFFTPVLFASGSESARTYAQFSKGAFRKNVALNMLYFLEQIGGEPEDRLCAAYANAAASLYSKGVRFRAGEAYTYAQVYCKGTSNPRYKSIAADAEQIISEIGRGNAIDAVWGTAKGLSSPINVAVIGGIIILTTAAPPVGGALAGARGAAIAQEIVVGTQIAAGTYFTSTLVYSASENLGLCAGQGISASKDCVAALTEAGMALMIAKSGPKHIRELRTADSLRVQAESLEARLKELDELKHLGIMESADAEISSINGRLELYRRFLSNPNALAIADQLKEKSKQAGVGNIIDSIADRMVADAAGKQASAALQLSVPQEAADILTFVEEIKISDGRFTREQALLPATQTQRLLKEAQLTETPKSLLEELRAAPKPKTPQVQLARLPFRGAKVVRGVIENPDIMAEVLEKLGINEAPEYSVRFLGEGVFKRAIKIDASVPGQAVKSFVIKYGETDIFEFEFSRRLGAMGIMQRQLTNNYVGKIDGRGVLIEEYVEGIRLSDYQITNRHSTGQAVAAEAVGKLSGRMFEKTAVPDGDTFKAFASFDPNSGNIKLLPDGSAKFIDIDPRLSAETNFPQFILPTLSLYAYKPSLIKAYFNGMLKHMGSKETAIKLLDETIRFYENAKSNDVYSFSSRSSLGEAGFRHSEFSVSYQDQLTTLTIQDTAGFAYWVRALKEIRAAVAARGTDIKFATR